MTIDPGWQGSLKLIYASHEQTTHVAHAEAKAPLKVQRSLYPEGKSVCHSIILHTAGGIVGGDRLDLDIQLQPQTKALITTAAAGKIYRTNGQAAKQTTRVEVSTGACLEWLPQETIVFDQSVYGQEMHVELAPEATWLGWEITRFGRSARGEQFLQGDWRSHTEIWQGGRPLWIDRQWLPGSEASFYGTHGLAGCPIVGSFAFVGQAVDGTVVEKARSLWAGTAGEIGVTRLPSGLLCRYRGHSTTAVRRWFVEVWQLVRLLFLGRSGCVPRVWGVS
ncbi:MAG: urease accessory protein UreD [Lyngbya sp. HA4199-MV5]|jgi:urease accessory protein|nr:urease accessory protein UreD [Lyngbya sp. HA4199-MV5]